MVILLSTSRSVQLRTESEIICSVYIMSPAKVPSSDDKSLKSRRKEKDKGLLGSFEMNQLDTDWAAVGDALLSSVITTAIWILVGAEIIFFATRPFAGAEDNPKGHLEYYFPSDMAKYPYFICTTLGIDPTTGKKACPYNGWKPKNNDGKQGPGIIDRVTELLALGGIGAVGVAEGAAAGIDSAIDDKPTQSNNQSGGGDFYSCASGSVNFDKGLPDIPDKPSFPYEYAGLKNDLLNQGWGTASATTAVGYIIAQMFVMIRGFVKSIFEDLRPRLAGGGIGQGVIMLGAGLIPAFWWAIAIVAYFAIMIITGFRAIAGQSTNYVGPYQETSKMAFSSKCKYWMAWIASYLVPVTIATWGGPVLAAVGVGKVLFDIITGPFRTADSRNTILRILSCNAPWILVIFGGTFLYSAQAAMSSIEWLGMATVYSVLAFITISKWYGRVH